VRIDAWLTALADRPAAAKPGGAAAAFESLLSEGPAPRAAPLAADARGRDVQGRAANRPGAAPLAGEPEHAPGDKPSKAGETSTPHAEASDPVGAPPPLASGHWLLQSLGAGALGSAQAAIKADLAQGVARSARRAGASPLGPTPTPTAPMLASKGVPADPGAARPSSDGPVAHAGDVSAPSVLEGQVDPRARGGDIARDAQYRAFALDELGMFGVRVGDGGAAEPAAIPAPARVAVLGVPSAPAPSVGAAAPVAGAPVAGTAGWADSAAGALAGAAADRVGAPESLVSNAEVPSVSDVSPEPVTDAIVPRLLTASAPEPSAPTPSADAARGEDARGAGPRGDGLDAKAAASPGPSLILSDANGALEVVAASTPLDQIAMIRLRRVADDVAAEFGERLTSVSLNGEPLGTAIHTRGGPRP
jgi:hypothetical protein